MSKYGNLFVKPGYLAKKKTEYELLRKKTIQENNRRANALGLKSLSNSLFGSPQRTKGGSTSGEKKERGCHDDDDEYQPSEGEEESSSSSKDQKCSRSRVKKVTMTEKRARRLAGPMSSILQTPPTASQTQHPEHQPQRCRTSEQQLQNQPAKKKKSWATGPMTSASQSPPTAGQSQH